MPTRCLLVVDDDGALRDLLCEELSRDYRVLSAATVHEASGHLREGAEIVLLDCSLPQETSMELARAADRLGIPVVLMSGYPDVDLWPDAEGRPFLPKPFSLSQARQLLASVLAGSDGSG